VSGFRFYQEFSDRRKRTPLGTVVAACVANGIFWSEDKVCYEGFVGVFEHPDSPVCWSAASLDYLAAKCKRIGEAEARKIHPALFARFEEVEP
jgi:hypothetical protein